MTRARIDRLAYIGWRGIHGCEVLELDEGPLTGLVGPSGAGKTTLVMCLDYALLPDRKALNIKPISDIQDSQKAGVDTLSSRIDPRYGYAYTALDISTRQGERLISGIFVQAVDGSADFTRWVIKNAPRDMPLQDILSITDGESEYHPELPELKRNLASKGIDLSPCRNVSEYGQALYEAGILPSNMSLSSDRTLYANLIETTFKGGITNEVAARLKEYLLPEVSQIPEIVRGLEECTNELIKTRSAVRDANKELELLSATYGVGKEITLHSLRWMFHDIDVLSVSVANQSSLHANANAELEMLSESIPQIQEQIETLADAKRNAIENAGYQLQLAHDNEITLTDRLPKLDGSLKFALSNKVLYEKCSKIWRTFSERKLQSFKAAIDWLDQCQQASQKKIAIIDLKMEELQEESERLVTGQSSQASEILADQLGGVSLEHALQNVNEEDALAIEMGLSGLVEGVVNVEIDALTQLASSEDLPEIFWLGKTVPAPKDLHEVGDWLLSMVNGGYVVANKKHRSIFGSEARDKRRKAIQGELDEYIDKRSKEKLKHDAYKAQELNLHANKDGILYYIENNNSFQSLTDAVTSAQADFDVCKEQLNKAREIRNESQKTIQNIQLPFEKQITAIQLELNAKISRKALLADQVKEYSEKCDAVRLRLSAVQFELESSRSILGESFDSMQRDARNMSEFKTESLISSQAKRLAKISDALKHESPARLAKLQDVNAEDRVSLIQLWPVLLEIVRDFVHTDIADVDGVDLIQAMQMRRANLDGELVKQENEVKIKARNIYTAIRANVQSQKKKIEKLSEFGKHIQFGNVVGIQIKLSPRTDMLAILEEFALQTSLFAEQRPIDEVLRNFFKASLTRKIEMSGEALLDYRNYVDLVIEAMRKTGDWEPAAALSGGEAIGCGLAIALMLTRSIAAKGEIKVDQISPLFAVDEVQRLHPQGQTLLVDFAKREGFQILVTATTMEPGFKCTLYALNRVYEPDERLVIRGVKIKRDAERNFEAAA